MDRDAPSILLLTTSAPELPSVYCAVTDALEFDAALRRRLDSLGLALVFTDFPLTLEQARILKARLPYLIVDVDDTRSVDTLAPGVCLLLEEITYFDRLTVRQDDRWVVFQARFSLSAGHREPWPYGDRPVFFDGAELSSVHLNRLRGPIDANDESATERAGSRLRKQKLNHLAEAQVVGRFLDELKDNRPGEQLNLIEYGSDGGRWCQTLAKRVHYLGVDGEMQLLEQARDRFPEAQFCAITEVDPALRTDAVLCCDRLNDGTERSRQSLRNLLSLASQGVRFLHLEDFSPRLGEDESTTIRGFEERLWDLSDGRVLLERCEIIRYPFDPGSRTRALIQTRWIGV